MEAAESVMTSVARRPLICRICGDVARGMNFGVLTCMSCKAFFRRNALRPTGTLRCSQKFKCEVNKDGRSHCPVCRLKKCFTLGMNAHLIQSFAPLQLSRPRPLGLLENDRSMLTFDPWNLLSNIVHLHDGETLLIQQKALLDKELSLPIRRRARPSLTLDFFHNCLVWMESLLNRSCHFQSLSKHFRQVLLTHNVRTCASFNGFLITRKLAILNDPLLLTSFVTLFGDVLLVRIFNIHQHLDHNDTLIKLFLFVMIFSSNCSPIASDSAHYIESLASATELIRVQDVFVTLLWKYLIYQYGLSEAVLRYSALVKIMLDMIYVKDEMALMPVYDEMITTTMKRIERSLHLYD